MISEITEKVKQKISPRTAIIKTILTVTGGIVVALIGGYFGFLKPTMDDNKRLAKSIDGYQKDVRDYNEQQKKITDRVERLESLQISESVLKSSDMENRK